VETPGCVPSGRIIGRDLGAPEDPLRSRELHKERFQRVAARKPDLRGGEREGSADLILAEIAGVELAVERKG